LLSDGRELLDFGAEGTDLPRSDDPLAWFDLASSTHQALRALHARAVSEPRLLDRLRASEAVLPRASAQLLAPVPRPGKFLCIGLNYRDHALEQGAEIPKSPLLFSKFSTSVAAPGQAVEIPAGSEKLDYEAELGVVIGRRARGVGADEALEHVLGYCCINDISARDFQFADGQWQRGQSCDTFGPMGPFIATTDELPDPHALRIQLRLNGKTLQDSSTAQLIFDVPTLIAFLSRSITLEPGDVIATGTPPGVGVARKPPDFMQAGDRVEVEIDGLGVLANPIVAG
jgi:2-keto-4-pentenoate hydratase/2-oxohepta-3-ene-1,7-dioic acid hydratase in catechol pathway